MTRRAAIARLAALLLAPALLGTLAGCNIVAPLAYIASGPPKVDARHKLDASRTHVVFIDDRASRLPRRSLRIETAEAVEQTLMRREVLPEEQVLTTRAAMRVASAERYGSPLSIAEIGASAGADVIIYATVDAWSLSRDGVSLSPAARGRVKVIDAAADERLFPPGRDGFPVRVELPQSPSQMPTGAERRAAHIGLAQAFGAQIARLFFQHERDALSGQLDD